MQQIASPRHPNPNGRASNRSVIIAILALLLFALSGLLTGFATGTFTGHKQTAQQNSTSNNNNGNKTNSSGNPSVPPIQTPSPQVSQTPDILVVGLGCPNVQDYTPQEVRGSSYKFQAQVTDKSADCKNGTGKPLHIAGVTCRLWLTKDNNFSDNIPKDRVASISTSDQPFPKEKENALDFNSATPQVQPCNAQGATSWQYQLSSSLDKGTYYLVVLATWKGTLYNWTARQIAVTKAD